jgi:hypothetical protein
MLRSVAMSSLLLCVITVRAPSAEPYVFTAFDYPGALDTTIQDINERGDIVGEFGNIDYGRPLNPGMQGFIRRGTDLQVVSFPEATQTSVLGLNNAGTVVGEYVDASNKAHGFIFDGTSFDVIDYPDAKHTSLADINDAGLAVGSYQDELGLIHAFQYDGTEFLSYDADFDLFIVPLATAFNGVNNEMTRVGTSTIYNFGFDTDEVVGFSYTPLSAIRAPQDITESLGVAATFAEGINESGTIVGRYVSVVSGIMDVLADVEYRGFIYDSEADSYADVDLPGGGCTFELVDGDEVIPSQCVRSLQGIDNEGTIVGYFDNNDGVYHGFIGQRDTGSIVGDFNGDKLLTSDDIDALSAEVRAGTNGSQFDLNGDGLVNDADRTKWVAELKHTYLGDADLDSEFNSGDLVTVLAAGQYEDELALNSSWATGDWDGDGDFTTSDLVTALADGGYEQGPRAAAAVVPEPESGLLIVICWAAITLGQRFASKRRRNS